jgi:AcrR family transcriptional regulator
MTAKRMDSATRRASIIEAAKGVFARYGLEGARTQQIATAAGVSEALLFRHFPSKTHIYRAVLRQVILDQNETLRRSPRAEPGTNGLLHMIRALMAHSLQGSAAHNAEGLRMVVGSIAGDGHYARLVYRRAMRLTNMREVLDAAVADGGLTGTPIHPNDATAFIEHVSTMVMMARCHEQSAVEYAADDQRVLADAVLFCARGLGIAEARVTAFLADEGLLAPA